MKVSLECRRNIKMGEKGIKTYVVVLKGSGFIRNYMQDKAVYYVEK